MKSRWAFAAVVLAALAFAAPALADVTYPDASNETPGSADISSVTVANDPASGIVTFKVQIANMPTMEDNAKIGIYVDADNDVGTGNLGVDCVLCLAKDGWFFGEWNGSSYEEAPGGLHVTYDNGLLTIMFDQSECNLSPTFVFWVTSFRGPDPNNPVTDDAPDGNDVFTYGMSTVAPAAKTSAVVTSGAPRSGRSFMVTGLGVLFADGTSRNMVGLNCTATLAGKRLRGSGTGGCLFALPKKAKHEKLVVRVSGEAANGAAYRKTVSYVVR